METSISKHHPQHGGEDNYLQEVRSRPYVATIFIQGSRVRKSKNFPDSKISTAKSFRIKCVNRDIDDFATNARKT